MLKLHDINLYWQKKADEELLQARTDGTLEYRYIETLNRDI